MKTLLITENFPPITGGSGRWFWELYRRLPREQFLIAAGTHPRQDEVDRRHALNLHRVPLTFGTRGLASLAGLRGYLGGLRRLAPLIAREHIGIIHCGRCLPEGLMARILGCWTGIPYACYVHGEELNTAATSRELTWLTRRVLAGARFVIVNSHNTGQILHRGWQVAAARLEMMHPGVDVERFLPAPPDDAARQRLGWSRRTVLLTVGRLQKRKGHDHLIRAVPVIRRQVPDILYAIIGAGEEASFLHELTVREGMESHVQFLGEVSDTELVRCYQQCDLFVLPNRTVAGDIEGFGMVLLEAQACGKPVVAGASGGTAETMHVPETGRVVSCDTPESLAELLCTLLSDRPQLQRMGEAGRLWVVEQFHWDKLARQAQEIFTRRVHD